MLRAYGDVAGFVERENQYAPTGITLALTQDRASVVQDRLDMIIANAAQGLIICLLYTHDVADDLTYLDLS